MQWVKRFRKRSRLMMILYNKMQISDSEGGTSFDPEDISYVKIE